MNTERISRSELAQIRTCALLENAADVCWARYENQDERTQKWSLLAHFATTVAYDLRRIAPAAVDLCEDAALEYACDGEDNASDVDCISWWPLEQRARRIADALSISFARHHGGVRNGQRVCECAECDALEAARDLARWISGESTSSVDHWSWDSYTGLLASRSDLDVMALEWWQAQMELAGAPVENECACDEQERQAA